MDGQCGERANLEKITVSYEFDEIQPEDNVDGTLEGSRLDVLAPPGETASEDQFTVSPENGSSDPSNLEYFEVSSQGTIRHLEETHCSLPFQKGGNISLNEGNSTLASKTDFGRIDCPTVTGTKVEVIEIYDSSEEEILDHVVSSDVEPDGSTFARQESKRMENAALPAGNQQPSSSFCIEKIQSGVFQAFENAMDGWYSKLSVHGPLKDCEIMESAQQLAQHFNFEFPFNSKWLAMFKSRNKAKTTGRNTDTLIIHDSFRLVKKSSQYGETVYSIENGDDLDRVSSPRNSVDEQELSYMGSKQNGSKTQLIEGQAIHNYHTQFFESPYKLPKQCVSESPDYPLLLIRAKNANSSERCGWSGGAMYMNEFNKIGQTKESTVNGKADELIMTTRPKKAKETGAVKRPYVGHTNEAVSKQCQTNSDVTFIEGVATECHSTLEDSIIMDQGPLKVTRRSKKAKPKTSVKRSQKVAQTLETVAKEGQTSVEVIYVEDAAAEYHSTLPDHKDQVVVSVTRRPKKTKPKNSVAARSRKADQTMKIIAKEHETNVEVTFTEDVGPVDAMTNFESQLLGWYLSVTSQPKLMVAASIFESAAVELAQSLNLKNFRPSKMWLKRFLGHHGMWCSLRDKRVLFLEPKVGLLKSRFDAEFDAWYYLFPTPPDYFLHYDRRYDALRITVNKYLAQLFDWYVSQSKVAASEIFTSEATIAEMVGLPDHLARSIEEFYSNWCFRHKVFYESVEEAYTLSLPVLVPSVLKNVAVRRAKEFRLAGFFCQQTWMRRFLQLNGLIYHQDEVVNCYMFDPTFCKPVTFDRIFNNWQVSCSSLLQDALNELVPEKVVRRKDPLAEVVNIKENPDPPLKIVSSFTLSNEPDFTNGN